MKQIRQIILDGESPTLNASANFTKGASDIDGPFLLVVICHSPINPVNELLISRALLLFTVRRICSPEVSVMPDAEQRV